MKKSIDVVALGELLIDLTQDGVNERGDPRFTANAGGAPCNVLAMLQKLGRKTTFIGKVGADAFGAQLRREVQALGVDVRGLLTDPAAPTTLAVVQTQPDGERDFSFYREGCADLRLREDELPRALLQDCKIFHFGTLSMTHAGVRAATQTAVRLARQSGALISFDPNLRLPLWPSPEEARQQMAWGLGVCDVLKIADNELAFLTGTDDVQQGAAQLLAAFPQIRMLNVTCGAKGSYSFLGSAATACVYAPAFLLGGTVDATGAGDAFCACVLHDVLQNGLDGRTPDSLRAMLRRANAAGYLVTTRKGAIPAMPLPAQIDALL